MRLLKREDGGFESFTELMKKDPYHTVLSIPWPRLLLLGVVFYWLVLLVFAGVFLLLPEDMCGLGLDNFSDAYHFSMQVIFGLGVPSKIQFFHQCVPMALLLPLELFIGLIAELLLVGLVYDRLSRGQTRAATVSFSRHACVNQLGGGSVQLKFQVVDIREESLIQARTSAYLVWCDGGAVVCEPLTVAPRHLLLYLPQTVTHVHRPPPDNTDHLRSREAGAALSSLSSSSSSSSSSPLSSVILERDTDDDEENDQGGRSRSRWEGLFPRSLSLLKNPDGLREYWKRHRVEVVCLVEGTEPSTGASVQARHSYTAEDMRLHCTFPSCIRLREGGEVQIQLDRFHEFVPLAPHSTSTATVTRPVLPPGLTSARSYELSIKSMSVMDMQRNVSFLGDTRNT